MNARRKPKDYDIELLSERPALDWEVRDAEAARAVHDYDESRRRADALLRLTGSKKYPEDIRIVRMGEGDIRRMTFVRRTKKETT